MSTTAHHKLPSGSLSTDSHRQLVAYFRSGWAFLIPYLAAYLLYAWLKWPVNPVAAGSSPVDGGQLAVSAIGALPSTGVPCLLHVYWFLHALHLVLGALALRAWWRESGATVTGATDDSESVSNRAAPPLLSTVSLSDNRPPSAMDRLWAAMPWLLLALLFYIPGVYLEWPSDPWEHLRRINEWRVLDTVAAHSTWMKSSYFIPYSLLSWCVGLRQIFWLDFYYTGICLLLCWQYYRLARACDLGERASMMFVLLQALLFGNNIFSFYRYYGISSSIYAQLGAVALTRIVLEAAKSPQLSLRFFFSVPPLISRLTVLRQPPTVYGLLLTGVPLLSLTAFNHVQGLGIAGLGIAAVVVWWLIEWRRSTLGWLALAAVGLSVATIFWFPRNPALDEGYRPQGWLTAWYGFNLFTPSSPAFDRAIAILGWTGLANLAAGLWIIGRNHVAGWLTLLPLLALCTPFITLPLITILTRKNPSDIMIIFNRTLFAIPVGLAFAVVGEQTFSVLRTSITHRVHIISGIQFTVLIAIIVAIVAVPADAPNYNRTSNSLTITPSDLRMQRIVAESTKLDIIKNFTPDPPLLTATRGIGFVLRAAGRRDLSNFIGNRLIIPPLIPSDDRGNLIESIADSINRKQHTKLILPDASILTSRSSTSGYLSGHWNSHQVALEYIAGPELETILAKTRESLPKQSFFDGFHEFAADPHR